MPGLSINKPGKPSQTYPIVQPSYSNTGKTYTHEERLKALNEYMKQEKYKKGQPTWWDEVMKQGKKKKGKKIKSMLIKKKRSKVAKKIKSILMKKKRPKTAKKIKRVHWSDSMDVKLYSLNNPIVFLKRTGPHPSHSSYECSFAPHGWSEFYGFD